jgi:GT2 family glycosyltransferase
MDISLIVPTHNRPRALNACVRNLLAQDHPSDAFEILVVDDGGQPDACTAVQRLLDGDRLRVLRQPKLGPGAARNHGAREARGKVLAFTDDDCLPDPGWAGAMLRACDSDSIVRGRTLNAYPGNLFAEASHQLVQYLYATWDRGESEVVLVTSNNMAVSRERFLRLGGFDERFTHAGGEDRDFTDRLVDDGGSIVAADDAVVSHASDLSALGFMRQHFTYGRSAFLFQSARADRRLEPPRLEPLRFYWRLVTWPAIQAKSPRAARLGALLAVSQLANAAGFFTQGASVRSGRKS